VRHGRVEQRTIAFGQAIAHSHESVEPTKVRHQREKHLVTVTLCEQIAPTRIVACVRPPRVRVCISVMCNHHF